MIYTQEQQSRFLRDEYEAEVDIFKRKLDTVATTLLLQDEEMFVGQLAGMKNGQMIMLFSNNRALPRIGDHFFCMLLAPELRAYRSWGLLSYKNLVQKKELSTDSVCIWHSKSDSDKYSLVGFRGIDIEFANAMEKAENVILTFGPAVPPYEYLTNLMKVVSLPAGRSTTFLQHDFANSVVSPKLIDNRDKNLTSTILNLSDSNETLIIQGPPGTGKTTLLSNLCAKLLNEGNSILVTALTNRALMELASKSSIKTFLRNKKVYKTNITSDEENESPNLMPIKDIEPIKGSLVMSTFYMTSGIAASMESPDFDYVIVDEASQALLPMIAASMKLGRKVVLIGDQKQLPPIVLTNEDLINRFNWSDVIKGFQTICSYFSFNSFMLSDTYRMTARGAECTGVFYNNGLRSVSEIQEVVTSIADLDPKGGTVIKELEMKVGDKNPQNAFEYIYCLTKSVLQENSKTEIAILSKFRETTRQLQKYFTLQWEGKDYPDNIKIDTIDRVQGLTVHFCFFLIPNASIRYSLEPELFNVATSRAMNNTIIVLPTTIYKELIPEEVKNYLIKAKLGCEMPASPQQKVISSGNFQVKVIDKIDLSKFETPKQKSVKSSIKRNIYIIDTNVFVNCPDIISKIGDKYLVVLSAKVIDELDRLKIKLSSDEKRNVEAALRYINKAMDKSNVRMELSDLSLLPNDFDKRSPDNNILTVALKFKGENPILLTSDNGLQVKAKGLNMNTISLKEFLKR